MRQKINRIDETNVNSYGSKMTIIEYNNCNDIVVEFENGYKVKSWYHAFKDGGIKSPYDKTVFKMGYIGEGNYNIKSEGKETIQYKYWHDMLKRCYNERFHKDNPTYKDCEVCEEWLCFQTFAKWFDNNYYECDSETMQLDKDISVKGNKIYSPETCMFVPQRINLLFTKGEKVRGEYPIGISILSSERFRARCSIINEYNRKTLKHLGVFDTPELAFYEGYKPFKEAYIKTVAEEYVGRIPFKLYEAMYRYVVEIDD